MQTKKKHLEMLDAAELLLSVSPMFKPCQQQTRDRSWSMQSLETLVDVASRAPQFSIGPSAASTAADPSRWKAAKPARDTSNGLALHGRSLLQSAAPSWGPGAAGAKVPPAMYQMKQHQKTASTTPAWSPVPCAATNASNCSSQLFGRSKATPAAYHKPAHAKKQRKARPAGGKVQHRRELLASRCPDVLPLEMHAIYFRQGRVGVYTQAERRAKIANFVQKRDKRVWHKKVRYSCRRNLAHQRIRVKGRFVKTDESSVPLAAETTTSL